MSILQMICVHIGTILIIIAVILALRIPFYDRPHWGVALAALGGGVFVLVATRAFDLFP